MPSPPALPTQTRIWALDVPTDLENPNLSRPYLFSSERINKPYHRVVGLPAPIAPLSAETTPCHAQPKHKLEHFRHPKLPSTFSGCAKEGASMMAVRVVVFSDALTVGVAVPHGAFDATGMGYVISALRCELHGDAAWSFGPPPPLFETNPAGVQIDALKAEPDSASKAAENSALPAWVSAAKPSHVVKFLLNYVIEKKWHHDEPRHFFISQRAVDGMIDSVKKEVVETSGGKEWVSTGDVLNAWSLKVRFRCPLRRPDQADLTEPVPIRPSTRTRASRARRRSRRPSFRCGTCSAFLRTRTTPSARTRSRSSRSRSPRWRGCRSPKSRSCTGGRSPSAARGRT